MDLPDLNQSWPDRGHEAIRQVVVQHIDAIADGFLLHETAADALLLALQHVANLEARVAALESAAPVPPAPPATSADVIL